MIPAIPLLFTRSMRVLGAATSLAIVIGGFAILASDTTNWRPYVGIVFGVAAFWEAVREH